jgi:murein DD-endopeptidase MepM/ murein hydrolase activator NlpD
VLKTALLHRRATSHDLRTLVGNYVILQSGTIFGLLVHRRCGSLQVEAGQAVVRGQVLQVGDSGTSLTPHLHFQVMVCTTGEQVGCPRGAHWLLACYLGAISVICAQRTHALQTLYGSRSGSDGSSRDDAYRQILYPVK